MITINARVRGHVLTIPTPVTMAAGSVEADQVRFSFDSAWDGLYKVALFFGSAIEPYAAAVDASGCAVIPWEVLTERGKLQFGVYGVEPGETTPRITSTLIRVQIPAGAWSESIANAGEPTPTLIEQFTEAATVAIGEARQTASDLSGTVTRSGRVICIDDALAGLEPVNISTGGEIYGRNFGLLNALSYTGNGVTFAVDADDPNTVTVSGTAPAGTNVYSYGSITTETARIRVPAGTYCMRTFSDDLGEQSINLYVKDPTQEAAVYVGPANTPTVLTFDRETQLGVRVQVPGGATVDATLHFYFGAVEADEYEPYYAPSETMRWHSTVVFDGAAGSIEYHRPAAARLGETAETSAAEIFDAVDGVEAVSLPASAVVYSRNMYRANLANRTNNGVTFRQDPEDLNTVHVSGTATADAYSFGGITVSNSVLLPAGTYYIAYYSDSYTDTTDKLYWVRLNTITVSSGAEGFRDLRDHCYKLVLSEPTRIAVRLTVKQGITVDDCVHLYISKYLPLPEYAPYRVPNGIMKRYSIVEGLAGGTVEYYRRDVSEDPVDIRVATFNVGDYSSGQTATGIPTRMDEYMAYISGLDAALLCTQEDRLIYDPSAQPPAKVFDVFYKYLYRDSETESYSVSTSTHTGLKRISSCFELAPSGRYTFDTQATDPEDETVRYWSSFTYSGLLIRNRHILLIDVHLAPKSGNARARMAQIDEMLAFVAACGVEDVIIAGDLNTWESSELAALRTGGYALANHGIYGAIPTWHEGGLAFDNVCVKSGKIKMRGVKAVENDLGDHYALTATLTVM